MAIPWLAVLKTVPWTEVIRNAPVVADGAKKLWNTLGKPHDATLAAPAIHGEALPVRLAELETAVADLHAQMLASSELIKALAEQNAQLIRRIEQNRVRGFWLAGSAAAALVAAFASLLVSLSS